MRMNALNAAVRSVARRRLGPGAGSGTPDVPIEQASYSTSLPQSSWTARA